jgi:hypothetical protein
VTIRPSQSHYGHWVLANHSCYRPMPEDEKQQVLSKETRQ